MKECFDFLCFNLHSLEHFLQAVKKQSQKFKARTPSAIPTQDLNKIVFDSEYGVELDVAVPWSSAFHV